MVDITYSWPPLPATDVDEVAAALGRTLGDAWRRVEVQRQRVLVLTASDARTRALARLREFQKAVEAYQAVIPASAQEYVRVVTGQYAVGSMQAAARLGVPATFTMVDQAVLAQLSAGSYSDFLRRSEDAGRTSERFARAVRAGAADVVPGAGVGRTSRDVAREFAEVLRDRYRIASVVYADGSMRTIEDYAEMAVRTKARVAYNAGGLQRFSSNRVGWVEVFDGPDCGWTEHGDPDLAHGSIRTVEAAAQFVIAHPRCRRGFGPRPDLTSPEAAEMADPLGWDDVGEDAPVSVSSGAAVSGAARREALAAARAERAGVP